MMASSSQIPMTAATRYPMIPIRDMPNTRGGIRGFEPGRFMAAHNVIDSPAMGD